MRPAARTRVTMLPTNHRDRGRWVHHKLGSPYPGPSFANPHDPLLQCVRYAGQAMPCHAARLKQAIRRRLGFRAAAI